MTKVFTQSYLSSTLPLRLQFCLTEKNIDLRGKLELFSNYAKNPQNVDLNAEVKFMFKVNSWFAASLQWATIYDDDIRIKDANGNVGPRLQFMSIIGLGITYKMANFKD